MKSIEVDRELRESIRNSIVDMQYDRISYLIVNNVFVWIPATIKFRITNIIEGVI